MNLTIRVVDPIFCFQRITSQVVQPFLFISRAIDVFPVLIGRHIQSQLSHGELAENDTVFGCFFYGVIQTDSLGAWLVILLASVPLINSLLVILLIPSFLSAGYSALLHLSFAVS